ncbi:hypothetical protein [Niallia endozanthoxylica]|uniref:Uncharacterized protein n=1 Tax=Niallia endozanthoxylica TaxID=2036016 RepID=A0A5J5HLA8_9BACI|nr:hypothetical protein [Niallia endozanthoxylica]KAA9021047.1 hypothetical protein F4V44_18050 [Niallia endozanthoxylica]
MSNHFIEQQAYLVSEEIRKSSLYNVVRVDVSGDGGLKSQQQHNQWNGKDLITKVILEDKEGRLYSVKPDHNGVMFAKGEITYKEYSKLQKKEELRGYGYFFASTGFLIIMMFALLKFLT